ncbi:MAG TPA: hypothetical protein VEW42_04515 [Candidatus Eisenbacteria bacterium]|nr:hypothetical protein [Candidatus Eisenbacteria bacterium]
MTKAEHDARDEEGVEWGRQQFDAMQIDEERSLPVGSFRASQSDDRLLARSRGAIEVGVDGIVVNGNHRWHQARRAGARTRISVRKVQSPYKA